MKKLLVLTIVLLLSGCATLVPTREEVAKLEGDINALFGEVQTTVAKINEAIQTSGSVLEAAQNVNKVTAPVNPYSGVIENVLGIVAALTVGGGAVAYKKNKDSNRVLANINKIAAESSPEEGKRIIAAVNGK